MNPNSVIDWAEFVATKFNSSRGTGWTYSRDTGGLEHIRYARDHTGYFHWTKRVLRAIRHLVTKSKFDGKWTWRSAYWGAVIALRKDENLPDGQVNGGSILTFWEEDGEYITLFGPTVGVKVIDFLKSEPDNVHAKEILTEMVRIANENFTQEEETND